MITREVFAKVICVVRVISMIASCVALCTNACAADEAKFLKKEELAEAQAIANELMAEHIAANKKGKESSEAVGDAAMELAKDAQGDAAKFVLLKGALTYYGRSKAYEKVADAVEAIMAQIEDVPATVLNDIVTKAAAGATEKKAPRLAALKKALGSRVKAEKSLQSLEPKLKASPHDVVLKRMHAELIAATGNWRAALEEFSKMDGETRKIAAGELRGEITVAADFWWEYSPASIETKDAIKEHASALYRQALNEGKIEGLKRRLAEKRIAEFTPVLATRDATTEDRISKSEARKKGLIHRWSFSGNLKDSVGGRDGKAFDGKVTFENGQVRICPGGGYVDLGANVIPGGGKDEYTIEVWATKYSIQKWARVFHIPDNWGMNDYYWTWNTETEPRKWSWKVAGYGAWHRYQGDGTGIGVENHFVVVYGHDEEKKPYFHVNIFRGENGYWGRRERLIGEMFKSHSAFWLGHSPFRTDATADASYNEVRIWNRAFTRDEMLNSARLGPDKVP